MEKVFRARKASGLDKELKFLDEGGLREEFERCEILASKRIWGEKSRIFCLNTKNECRKVKCKKNKKKGMKQ